MTYASSGSSFATKTGSAYHRINYDLNKVTPDFKEPNSTVKNRAEGVGRQIVSASVYAYGMTVSLERALNSASFDRTCSFFQEYHLTKLFSYCTHDWIGGYGPETQVDRFFIDHLIHEWLALTETDRNVYNIRACYDAMTNGYVISPETYQWIKKKANGLIQWFPNYDVNHKDPEMVVKSIRYFYHLIGFDTIRGNPEDYRMYRNSYFEAMPERKTMKLFFPEDFIRSSSASKFVGTPMESKIAKIHQDKSSKLHELNKTIVDLFGEHFCLIGVGSERIDSRDYVTLHYPLSLQLYLVNMTAVFNRKFAYNGCPYDNNVHRANAARIERIARDKNLSILGGMTIHPRTVNPNDVFNVKRNYLYALDGIHARHAVNFRAMMYDSQFYISMPYTIDSAQFGFHYARNVYWFRDNSNKHVTIGDNTNLSDSRYHVL